ncbi:MAG: hypothetical protein U0636_03025 [Phycisphaerales bacterium]
MNVLRNVLAGFAGVLCMFMVVIAGDGVTGMIHPPSPALQEASKRYSEAMRAQDATAMHAAREDLRAQLAGWPLQANLMMVAGWALAALVGGGVAAFLAPHRACTMGLLVGVLDALGIVANSMALPHPLWMPIAGVVGALALGLGAGVMVAVRHAKQKAKEHALQA